MANPAKQTKSLLFFALFNSIVGFSILFPILAPLSRSLGLSEVEVGWLATSYSLMQFIGSPYFGRLSERVGRKPVLLLGVFGYAVGFASFGVIVLLGQHRIFSHATLVGLLLAARMLGGLLSSATLPAAQAYIADITAHHERTAGMALVGAAFGLGLIFGPILGAILSRFGLLVPVWASTAVAIVNGLFIVVSLPVVDRRPSETPVHAKGILRRTAPVLAVAFVMVLASVAMEQTVAFLYQDTLALDAAATARSVGAALGIYGLSAVIAQGFVVRRASWSPMMLMRLGVTISLIGFGGLIVAGTFGGLSAALAIQGFGYGLAMPGFAALLSISVGEREQGEVAGLNSSTQALGRTIGPLIGTSLYRLNPRYPYVLSLLVLVGVMLLLSIASRFRNAPQIDPHA